MTGCLVNQVSTVQSFLIYNVTGVVYRFSDRSTKKQNSTDSSSLQIIHKVIQMKKFIYINININIYKVYVYLCTYVWVN